MQATRRLILDYTVECSPVSGTNLRSFPQRLGEGRRRSGRKRVRSFACVYGVLRRLPRTTEIFDTCFAEEHRRKPPVCRPGGPLRILLPHLSARESCEPDFEATHPTAHPLSFIAGYWPADPHSWKCLAQMHCGTTLNSARVGVRWAQTPPPEGIPWFLARRAGFSPLMHATDSSKNIFRLGSAHKGTSL